MKNFGRNILFWLVAGTLMFMLLDNYSSSSLKEELTYSEFKQEVKGKKVKSIVYKGDQMTVEVERFNGTKYTTQKPAYISDQDLNESLTEADVEIAFEAIEKPSVWSQLLIGAFPLLLLLAIFFIFMSLSVSMTTYISGNPLAGPFAGLRKATCNTWRPLKGYNLMNQ